MDRRKIALPHNATLEEQAHLMSESGLLALPVVDEQGRLIGAMDAGDMIRSVVQESTAEIHHLAGLDRDETLQQTTATTAYRSFWLLSSLLVAFLLAWLISGFTQVISSAVLLVALLPLAMRPGGQAGVQTLTFVTRALTLGKIGACDIRRVIGRELLLALLNGMIIGGLASLGGWLWQGQAVAGLVIGVAVFAHLVLAALIGAGVPLVCRAMNIDPTRVSSMVVSAATDACGIALMLSIATLALQMGYL
jgi:magnesium transporter